MIIVKAKRVLPFIAQPKPRQAAEQIVVNSFTVVFKSNSARLYFIIISQSEILSRSFSRYIFVVNFAATDLPPSSSAAEGACPR